ncbi:MAG: AAA family ATPase [Candidatus Bathyarchaeia archaeon]
MIKNLKIENFKSIKQLKLECKRINLFIGEPNTGKSNILETMGLLSHVYHPHSEYARRHFFRFENMIDIFYDHVLGNDVRIIFDEKILKVQFKNGFFIESYVNEKGERIDNIFHYTYLGEGSTNYLTDFSSFKFYRFVVRSVFPSQRSEFLSPPDGDNLLAVVLVRKDLRTTLKQIFDNFGLTLVFEPQEGKIKVQKQLEDIIISFPYSLASETLQRLVFYLTAIYSNKDSVLAFEEPEAHAFPYYTKYLAEIIAQNKNNNQYFISTHNPYFLLSVLEKAPKDEVAIFCTRLEDYQTKVKALTEEQIGEILEKGIDIFLNVERFLEGA